MINLQAPVINKYSQYLRVIYRGILLDDFCKREESVFLFFSFTYILPWFCMVLNRCTTNVNGYCRVEHQNHKSSPWGNWLWIEKCNFPFPKTLKSVKNLLDFFLHLRHRRHSMLSEAEDTSISTAPSLMPRIVMPQNTKSLSSHHYSFTSYIWLCNTTCYMFCYTLLGFCPSVLPSVYMFELLYFTKKKILFMTEPKSFLSTVLLSQWWTDVLDYNSIR